MSCLGDHPDGTIRKLIDQIPADAASKILLIHSPPTHKDSVIHQGRAGLQNILGHAEFSGQRHRLEIPFRNTQQLFFALDRLCQLAFLTT